MKRLQCLFSISLIAGLLLFSQSIDFARSHANKPARALAEEPRDAGIVGIVTQQGLSPDLLAKWSSDDPQQITESKPVTGLEPDEKINGAALDPETNTFIAISNFGQLFRINPETGKATILARISPSLARDKLAFDYDPATKKVRIINKQGMNIEITLSDIPAMDFGSPVTYDSEDINAGKTPLVTGLAHNQIPDVIDTRFFAIDSALDILVLILDSASGKMKTIGNLGVDTSECTGFDIAENSNFAFASFKLEGETLSRFYEINLDTGEATETGIIGSGIEISSIIILLGNNPAKIECNVNPPRAINPVGTSHSLRVTVTKDGKPVKALILINILAGPNKGVGKKGRAEDDPETEEDDPGLGLTYDSNGKVGTDVIVVGFIAEGKIGLCTAIKIWSKGILIDKVIVDGKKMRVEGCCFESGDKVIVNGKEMATKRDTNEPALILIVKKGGKKIKECTVAFTNKVLVRRQRPGERAEDSDAFATCP